MTPSFEEEAIRAIARLKPGEVVSYGEIAEQAGSPRAARAVGTILARSDGLPWWRVVRADGTLVAPKKREQARLLRKEGVVVSEGKVRR